jgi:hypothetical protein
LGEKVRLTKKQVLFITEFLEIESPEKAAERVMEIMIEERMDPVEIGTVIDRAIKNIDKVKK